MTRHSTHSILRPIAAGLAVVGSSIGATACSDDDGNEDEIDSETENEGEEGDG